MILVDLDYGQEIEADEAELLERGLPEGFVTLESLTKEQLWAKIQDLMHWNGDWNE